MGLSIKQVEKLLDDLATQEELLCKRADDASGYTRSGNESIRTSYAKTHEQHAKEYRQILRYLAKYRLMQADYEARLKADLKTILVELQLEIEKLEEEADIGKVVMIGAIDRLIQQKIDLLKKQTIDDCDNCFNGTTRGGCAVKELMKDKDCKYYMPK